MKGKNTVDFIEKMQLISVAKRRELGSEKKNKNRMRFITILKVKEFRANKIIRLNKLEKTKPVKSVNKRFIQ